MEFQLDPFKLWDIYLDDKNNKKRKIYFQEIDLKMRGKIWQDFIDDMTKLKIHVDFFDWWDIVKTDYIKTDEKEINASTSQTKEWKKTRDQSIDNTTYPPFEEIEINYKGAKIIAAPFKEVNGNSDLEKIKSQNNYTNQILKIMTQQMENMEVDKKKKKKIEKPLIKPSEELKDFKLNNDEELIKKITKQLELLDLKTNKQVLALTETESTRSEDSDNSLSKQFKEKVEINKLIAKKYNRPKIPHYYARPSLPDVQLEDRWSQSAYDDRSIYNWNLDGKSEHGIMEMLNEMCMASSAARVLGNSDRQIATSIAVGFSGQLKGWWENYLTLNDRLEILNTVKPEIENGQTVNKENTFSTLIYAITKHFSGSPVGIAERASAILANLTCPKLQDFKWYKDMFLSKVYLRDDCQQPYWIERFVAGLPKLFAERIRSRLKRKSGENILRYEIYSYGELINEINLEGLELRNELKLKSKLKQDRLGGRQELGTFCEQYGYEKRIIKRKPFRKQSSYEKKGLRKRYKTRFTNKPRFIKRKNKLDTKKATCYKCGRQGHYKKDCPLLKRLDL